MLLDNGVTVPFQLWYVSTLAARARSQEAVKAVGTGLVTAP